MSNQPTDAALFSFARRGKRILDELRQMKTDIDHWNSAHPNEDPITVDFDLSLDVARLVEANKAEGTKG